MDVGRISRDIEVFHIGKQTPAVAIPPKSYAVYAFYSRHCEKNVMCRRRVLLVKLTDITF